MATRKYKHFDIKESIKKLDKVNVHKIELKELIFKSRHGLIFVAKFNNKKRIVKMMILTSKKHPNKNKYYYGKRHLKNLKDKNYFANSSNPFKHMHKYKLHNFKFKPVPFDEFIKEAYELDYFDSIDIGPKYDGYDILNKKVRYGFLVMDKVDTSVKNILLKRDLSKKETNKIYKFINKMHYKYNITHGDLKPSNIGVFLDKHGKIDKCVTYDCKKARHYNKMRSKYSKMELRHYDRHVKKNLKER